MKQIVGAGLAGLVAAHAWPGARVFEAAAEPRAAHRAVLRFRSDAVARLTGVEFRRVRVRKGIFYHGGFHAPNIALANLYAQKIFGFERLVGERSIWSVEPVDRFVAPIDFHEQLIEAVRDRIEYGTEFDYVRNLDPVVSTAPMPVVLRALGREPSTGFHRSAITVQRWRIDNCDVFQTIYFPEPDTNLYRASITGDTLIAEFVGAPDANPEPLLERAFGVGLGAFAHDLGTVEQKYGKIADIPAQQRKALLFELTHEFQIYSLGRFATWRNILLDDVVADIDVIKRLLKSSNPYDLRRAAQ